MSVRTLTELFREAVRRYDRPDAFRIKRDGRWRPVSHREALAAVEECAAGLLALGIAAGDRLAVFSENRLEWAIADYAILGIGAINVPIYPTLPPASVEHLLLDSESRLVFVSDAAHLHTLVGIRPRLQDGFGIVVMDDSAVPPADAASSGRIISLRELRELGRRRRSEKPGEVEERSAAVKEGDVASIIYTSGTTGTPKGAMLTHANIVSNVQAARAAFPVGPSDSCLSFLPLCHIFERMAGHFTMMDAGATISYAESVDLVPANLTEVRPTILVSVPRLYEKMHARVLDAVAASSPLRRRLFDWGMKVGRARSRCLLENRPVPAALKLQYALAERFVFAKLKARLGGRIKFMVSGGAPLSPEIASFFHAAGVVILEGYGLTETSPVIAVNRIDAMRLGTVGPLFPGVEVKIADDGEILARGPGIMKGYYRMPQETAAALEDGWFHTGDIGRLDPDGFLMITDRKKELIVTAGGKKVAPQPIENRLKADPYVAEAIVLGDRRPYCAALIVPDFDRLIEWARGRGIVPAGGSIERSVLCRLPEVSAFLMERVATINADLASFEQIKRIALIDRELTVEAGDLTPTLKVRRRRILEQFGERIDALYGGNGGAA